MPQWDQKEFDAKASELAQAFLAGRGQNGSDLCSLATKVARDNSLNPEQIKRLCRMTNVKTFESKFASMKGGADRIVEFDPIDADSVISQLTKVAAPVSITKVATALYPDLADEVRPIELPAAPEPSEAQKVASFRQSIGPSLSPEKAYMRAVKLAQETDVRIASADRQWKRQMEQLVSMSKRAKWDHDGFEKDAIALFGEDVMPELNALRVEKRMEPIAYTSEKIAELQDRLFGNTTVEAELVKSASEARGQYMFQLQRKEEVAAQIKSLRKEIFGE